MRLSAVRLIAARELRERTRATGFRVTTAIGILLIASLFFLPAILHAIQNSEQKHVAVVDPTGQLTPALQAALPDRLPNGKPSIQLRAAPSLAAAERSGSDGVLVPGNLADPSSAVTYRAKHPGGTVNSLRAALTEVAANVRLRHHGLSSTQVQRAFTAPTVHVHATGGKQPSAAARGLVYVLLLMLYLTVLIYGAGMASSIIQEKASRITELMIAAVTPMEYMAGKVGGAGLAGLVQYGCWLVAGLAVLVVKAIIGSHSLALASVGVGTLVLFVVFFLLGYAFYGIVYAALSAPASRVEDGTVLGQPLMVIIIVAFACSFVAIQSPDDPVVVVASMIPPFAPMVMFTRIALSSVPVWQVAVAIVALVLATGLAARALAKLFRIGLLLYGKRPGVRDLMRMLRTA